MSHYSETECHRSTYDQFFQQIGHLYPTEVVKGLYEQQYNKITPLPGFGFVTTHLEEPIKARPFNGKLRIQALLNELGHEYIEFAHKNPELTARIIMVEQYGCAHFIGSNGRDLSIPLLSTLVDCMGILIKDDRGNVTAAHVSPFEQYGINHAIYYAHLHRRKFGDSQTIRIAVAGMSNLEKTREKIAPISIQPPTLQSFTKLELEEAIHKIFPETNFKIQLFESTDMNNGSMSIYDLATTTIPTDPIVAKKHIIAAPAHY
jgi:hypothetical protein